MTSIHTNSSAMTALQSLQSINNSLDDTQSRISTGYRVAEAQDNAAYWSIATTMRSDNQAMSAVVDSLGIGAATVDAAYTGLDSAKDVLSEIKAKLTTATSDGVDKAKVQEEIGALQEQLKTISDSASFSGQNWLSNTDATTGKQIVSSLSRDAAGSLSVGKIDVDIAGLRLYSADAGIIDKDIDIDQFTTGTIGTASVETTAVDFAATDDKMSFSISQNGDPARTVEITQQTLADAGLSDTSIRSDADLKAVFEQALSDAGIDGVEVEIDATHNVSFTSLESFTVSAASFSGTSTITEASLGLDATSDSTAAATGSFSTSVEDIDITSANSTEIQAYIKVVDEALSQVTTAASSLGAVQNRIDMQTEFVSKLMDTVSEGVGTLVDADMTEESTRLKALQTQQQLGVQALSIANNSSQSLLSLFR
ncbi:flagellin N-terminal helical domain-containing protein [Jiella marina]|uniref:flagellin N-terminal helical domain-containing protein n=1 Tax=Jiella sp. LLJ827 TaxID=2917712 RepID=UPI002101B944|nr:flagellin [Jiella sp. LLJ827]MCQ0988152.1 flagellin C [Jiella sp. LLJ827]